jgi:tetratricopeptide (TPR) repeat protein
MASALARFWNVRGHYELGRRSLEEALDRADSGAPSEVRATALVRLGAVALHQGDYAAARPRLDEALALCRQLGDERGEVRALGTLGIAALYHGDLEPARVAFEEGLALYRKQKNDRGAAVALHNLASVAHETGRFEHAARLYEEALGLFLGVGDRASGSLTQGDLARTWLRLDRTEKAREFLSAGLSVVAELSAKREGAYGLEATSDYLFARGRPHESALCLGAASAIREEIGSPMAPYEKAESEKRLARLSESLGDAKLSEALREAAPWSFEDAIAKARAWVSSV